MKSFYYLLPFFCCALISTHVHSQNFAQLNPGSGLLPVPQKVTLSDTRYLLDGTWSINTTGAILKTDPAIISLTSALKERFGLTLNPSTHGGTGSIQLIIKPGSVKIGESTDSNRTSLSNQAYRLKLDSRRITISANHNQGLFYGIQTFIQLLKENNGKLFFAGGVIEDWPNLDLRMIYWDDAHHLERLDAMKWAIRQASYYKINAFSLKLEGHFEFSVAKPIIEPYAYTPKELQELTNYAKAHYVELVPYLDAPAHISFILKHPEYANLRSFPNSNYELSVTNPKADALILGMANDLIEANKGGKYFLLSTDEAYYAGQGASEKKRAEELGSNGKLLAEYITRISNQLHKKGRKVIIWAEYPLTAVDINSIPSQIINGVYNNAWAPLFNEHGIRQLIYTSTQGEEPLFPNYYKFPDKRDSQSNLALSYDKMLQSDIAKGSINEVLKEVTSAITAGNSNFMGVIVAAWGDAGLHPETFWLGYAAGAATGWNHKQQTSQDLLTGFFSSFYGGSAIDMDKVYQLLSSQCQFWENSWEWEVSKNRTPIFGNSDTIYATPMRAKDQRLEPLPVPSAVNLSVNVNWVENNKDKLVLVEKYLEENDKLMKLLQENMVKADYQHYNLQVLFTIAQLCRQSLNMLLDLKRINEFLILASNIAPVNPLVAISLVDQALDQVTKIRNDRNLVLDAVTTVWYHDWYPRVAEANGRKYLDQVDDVKDHPPARTVDMSYLIYRELKYPLGQWAEEVRKLRNQFARDNNLNIRGELINWLKY
jgi:hexosaminidase